VFYIEDPIDVSSIKQYIMNMTDEMTVIQLLMTIVEKHPTMIRSSIIEQPFSLDIRALRHFRLGKSPAFYQSLASKLWASNIKQIFYVINGLGYQ
jgi:hypothetical protein